MHLPIRMTPPPAILPAGPGAALPEATEDKDDDQDEHDSGGSRHGCAPLAGRASRRYDRGSGVGRLICLRDGTLCAGEPAYGGRTG